MRCTKCGYISFDHLEICKKCNKAVNRSENGINGTVFDTEVPGFLRFDQISDQELVVAASPDEPSVENADVSSVLDGSIETAPGSAPEDDEFFLELDELTGDNGTDEAEGEDDIILNLDDLEETGPLEEFMMDTAEESEQEEKEGPTIDFGDLDISDLGPPEAEPAVAQAEEEPLISLENELAQDQSPVGHSIEKAEEEKQDLGLEDLLLDELELKNIEKPRLSRRQSKPTVTGTALDNFDVDLGELFAEEKL